MLLIKTVGLRHERGRGEGNSGQRPNGFGTVTCCQSRLFGCLVCVRYTMQLSCVFMLAQFPMYEPWRCSAVAVETCAERDSRVLRYFTFFLLRKEVQPSRRAPPFVGAESITNCFSSVEWGNFDAWNREGNSAERKETKDPHVYIYACSADGYKRWLWLIFSIYSIRVFSRPLYGRNSQLNTGRALFQLSNQ